MKWKIGATNKFPQGKLDSTDEGELRLAIAADIRNRVVRIEFGKPVAWIGLPVVEAEQFVNLLQEKIKEIKARGN